jgi:hypothetical protein
MQFLMEEENPNSVGYISKGLLTHLRPRFSCPQNAVKTCSPPRASHTRGCVIQPPPSVRTIYALTRELHESQSSASGLSYPNTIDRSHAAE